MSEENPPTYHCPSCDSKTWVYDEDRCTYYPDLSKPFDINGTTTFEYKWFVKCSECGFKLGEDVPRPPEKMIVTMFIKDKE